MLRYIGHPFIDVGVATILAHCRTDDRSLSEPEDITEEHIERFATWIAEQYVTSVPLRSLLRNFFPNSGFVQPAYAKNEEARWNYAHEVLFAWRRDVLENVACTFFPEKPATMYAFRQHIPLLNAGTVHNFSAIDTLGIPASGVALLAIHALPFGTLYCSQHCSQPECKVHLMFHELTPISKMPDMTFHLARYAYQFNTSILTLAGSDDDKEALRYGTPDRTRYIDEILRVRQDTRRRRANPTSITAYFFSNENRQYHFEMQLISSDVIRFIEEASQVDSNKWNLLVSQGWEQPKVDNESKYRDQRNEFYVALTYLPEGATSFLRRFLLHTSWPIVKSFMKRIFHMTEDRIDLYRRLGDVLAKYIHQYERCNLGFYYAIARASSSSELYGIIRNAAEKVYRGNQAQQPLITFDDFTTAFENPDDRFNMWKVARDLIAVRMLEQLHELCPKAAAPEDINPLEQGYEIEATGDE
jgi:hypothetical protein